MYDKLLREKELKVTPQRIFILEEIKNMGHASVEALHDRVKSVYSSVSLATIYKNLHLLVEEDILREVPVQGKKPYYEINTGDHVHIVCTSCGCIEDSHDIDSSQLLENAQSQSGKKFGSISVTLLGLCKKCGN